MRVRSIWQTITFQQQETAEIKNRIRAAWAKFHRYKQKLTSRSYFSPHRLRLFNMVITPMLSYASGNWTLSKEHERKNDRLNAKCFTSSYKQRENTKRKLSPARTAKTQKTELQTTEAQTKKLRKVAVQTEIATKTATFPSRKTPMKRLRRLNELHLQQFKG